MTDFPKDPDLPEGVSVASGRDVSLFAVSNAAKMFLRDIISGFLS